MKTSDLFKVVPVAAIALSVYSTSAMAGATNRGENTAATPGPKATTTTTPAQGETNRKDMRRGTTNTEDIDTPDRASELNRPGSGAAGGTGASPGNTDAAGSGSAGGRSDVGGQTLPEQLEQDPSDDTYDSNR
jgi:hypothetical protein